LFEGYNLKYTDGIAGLVGTKEGVTEGRATLKMFCYWARYSPHILLRWKPERQLQLRREGGNYIIGAPEAVRGGKSARV